MKTRNILLSVGFILIGTASCMSHYEGTPGVEATVAEASKTETEADMKSPLMFKEAGLPKDFPPPGPVGEIIVKEYPSYRLAKTTASSGDGESSGKMFWPLFQHIKKNDIAMTAPVEMTFKPEASSRKDEPVAMAFLYGDPNWGKIQKDGSVEVMDMPAMTVLSVTIRSGYEKGFEKGIAMLRQWMDENPGRYEVDGPPRFLGYNSPMVPGVLQIGEVQLPVKAVVKPVTASK